MENPQGLKDLPANPSDYSPANAIRKLDGNLGTSSFDGRIIMAEYLKGKEAVGAENKANLKRAVYQLKRIYSEHPEIAQDQIKRRIKIEAAPLALIYERNKSLPYGSQVDISELGFNVALPNNIGSTYNLSQKLTADIAVVKEILNQFTDNAAALLEKEFPTKPLSTPIPKTFREVGSLKK